MSDIPVIWFMNDTVFMTHWMNYIVDNINIHIDKPYKLQEIVRHA